MSFFILAPDTYSLIYRHLNQTELYRLSLTCRFFGFETKLKKILCEIHQFLMRKARVFVLSAAIIREENYGGYRGQPYINYAELKCQNNYQVMTIDEYKINGIPTHFINLSFAENLYEWYDPDQDDSRIIDELKKIGIAEHDVVILGTHYDTIYRQGKLEFVGYDFSDYFRPSMLSHLPPHYYRASRNVNPLDEELPWVEKRCLFEIEITGKYHGINGQITESIFISPTFPNFQCILKYVFKKYNYDESINKKLKLKHF